MRAMIGSAGINTQPESWTDWLNRFIPIVNQRDDWRMQGCFYATDALTVEVSEGERVQTFADILTSYSCEIHAIGHSNGTRVLLDGWKACDNIPSRRPRLTSVHLLCGACDADCDINGINAGILGGTIGDVFIYVANSDRAMRIEDTFIGKRLFEVGTVPLGLNGPNNVNQLAKSQIHVIDWSEYDHSTCWDAEHFNATVLQVMNLAETSAQRQYTRHANAPIAAQGLAGANAPAVAEQQLRPTSAPLLAPRQAGETIIKS